MDERNEQQLDEQEIIDNEPLIGQITFDELIAELRLWTEVGQAALPTIWISEKAPHCANMAK